MQRGVFIVLEGIDGCGKTTIAELLKTRLPDTSINTLVTKEPTKNTLAGKKIHAILKHKKPAPKPFEMQKLYIADRKIHDEKIIFPALANYRTVICQRYALSTFAYGMAFGIPRSALRHQFIMPDITFLLDLTSEEAMKRIAIRRHEREYFEKLEKLEKIREQYLKLQKIKIFGKIVLIDAHPSPKMIVAKILSILES